MRLRVVADPKPGHRPDHVEPFAVAGGVPAVTRAARPGVALAPLDLALTGAQTAALEADAAAAGVTVELWAMLTIEVGRALDAAARALTLPPGGAPATADIAQALDRHAADALDAPLPARSDQLAAYARELRRARPRPTRSTVDAPLGLSLPTATLLAWRLAAAEAGLAVAAWASQRADQAPTRVPVSWEAASAERGLALGEWVALQAASWSASRSAADHNRA